jgi:hypothetical protein
MTRVVNFAIASRPHGCDVAIEDFLQCRERFLLVVFRLDSQVLAGGIICHLGQRRQRAEGEQ